MRAGVEPRVERARRDARGALWTGACVVACLVACLVANGAFCGASARADDAGLVDCGGPVELGPLEFFPAAGASGVSLDAPVRVRYTPGFFDVWRDPLTRLLEVRDASDAPVPGTLERLGDTLIFRPAAPWQASAQYTGTAFGIDILQARFRFRTGTSNDTLPPIFDGTPTITPAAVDARPCVDGGGYRIDVSVAPATDSDGAGGDLEYLLFQTRGPGIERPVLRSRVRNFAGVSIPLAFTLAPSEAVSPICVVVVAVDAVGHTAEGPLGCVDPIQGNFFAPACGVSAPGAGGASSVLSAACGLFAALLVRIRGRRRAR